MVTIGPEWVHHQKAQEQTYGELNHGLKSPNSIELLRWLSTRSAQPHNTTGNRG
jgi:hypothetical protein